MDVIEGILDTIKRLTKRVQRLEVHKHTYPTLSLGTPTELTIAAGVVTRTQSYHIIDTEGDAATDDLVTIAGGNTGDILIIRPAADDRTIVAKDTVAANSLLLAGDFSMDHSSDTLVLLRIGTYWAELSRSDNGA